MTTKLIFQTTDEQRRDLQLYINDMEFEGIDVDFLNKVMSIAWDCQGMFDLVEQWSMETGDSKEQHLTMVVIEDLVKDHERWEAK